MCTRGKVLVEEEQAKARNYEEVSLRIIHIASEDVITASPDTGIDYPWGE